MGTIGLRLNLFRNASGWRTGIISLFACFALSAQEPNAVRSAPEAQVKAAFLLNFARFVDWPSSGFPNPSTPLTICVVGRDPFGPALDAVVAGETVGSRPIEIRRIESSSKGQCHLAFIASAEDKPVPYIPLISPNVLTVGEGEAFLRAGGIISFVVENRRVRFSINQSAAQRAGLRISSRLLSLARTVER